MTNRQQKTSPSLLVTSTIVTTMTDESLQNISSSQTNRSKQSQNTDNGVGKEATVNKHQDLGRKRKYVGRLNC